MSNVPDQYRPNPDKPWRVAWGFGAFEDFATEEEARRKFESVPDGLAPMPPRNTIEEKP